MGKKASNPPPPTAVISATLADLKKTFTEWDRRYRKDPDKFMSEASHLLKETPETYGDAATPYFVKLLGEMQGRSMSPCDREKALLIVGPPGSGKSRRAREEALKRGGDFATISNRLPTPFALGAAMACNTRTVVIDEFPSVHCPWPLIKSLASESEILVERKGRDPEKVKAPFFIFVVQGEAPANAGRRFEVIDLN